MKITLDARMIRMSGIGRYIRSILRFLLNRYDVTLLGNRTDLSGYQAEIIEMKSGIYSPAEQLEYIKLIKPTDIFWSPHFNVPVFKIPAVKRFVTIHDVFQITPLSRLNRFEKLYARYLFINAVKKSDVVFTISRFTMNEIIGKLNLDTDQAGKIKVIYRSAESGFTKKYDSKDGNKVLKDIGLEEDIEFVLFVGNLKPNKNITGLLHAFHKIRSELRNYKLIIVGKKENFITGMDNIKNLVKQLQLEKDVIFTGIINDEQLVKLYHFASVLVLPSFYEGFGLPPVEAMACGCPVVVSDIPPLREVCGDSAYYVDPYSINDIASGILKTACDLSFRNDIILKGFERVKYFSESKSIEEYVKAIDGL